MATKTKSAAKTKIAPAPELKSWTIGENSNQIGTIREIKFGTNNKGTAQVRIAATCGRTANGNVNWFYAEALGKATESFKSIKEGDLVKLYSTFECSEYMSKTGTVELYLSHKILFAEAA